MPNFSPSPPLHGYKSDTWRPLRLKHLHVSARSTRLKILPRIAVSFVVKDGVRFVKSGVKMGVEEIRFQLVTHCVTN